VQASASRECKIAPTTLYPAAVIIIRGIGETVPFAGLVAPGEFQFNVLVPPSLANGDQPVTAM
jgi:uncharacterized protein (TIGR03437 family)